MMEFENIDRRALMLRAMQLVGATIVLGGGVVACKQAEQKGTPLGSTQMALLSAIADTIIPATDTPGAVAAGVPKKLDDMLVNWASEESRTGLNAAMDEIEKLAMSSAKTGFAALDPAKRKALLLPHDKAAVAPGPPPKEKPTGFAAMMGGAPKMNPNYVRLKELIINLYYNTEVAMTKELIFEPVPGKYVPSMKVTPQTRPFAGLGGPF